MDVTIAGDPILRPLNDDQLTRLTIELAAFDGEIGTGAVPMDDPNADDEYRGGRQLRIDEGATVLVDGFIGDQDRTRGPVPIVNREVVYSQQDPNALLFAKRARRLQPEQTDVARVLDFAGLDLPGVDTTMVLNTNTATMPKKRYDGEGWAELITDTVELTGKTIFIHDLAAGGRCLHYHRLTEGHACGLSITDVFGAANGVTSFIPANPQKKTSPAELGNNLLFVDQDGRTATYTDATSITNHDADGLAHQKIIRVEARSQAHLNTIAATQGPESKDERFTWVCTIGPLDEDALALIRVGDLMTVTSQVMGLTAATKRIAHLSLSLTKDKNGNAITGRWDALLELGAPVRRPGKGKSLPKPPLAAPSLPPFTDSMLVALLSEDDTDLERGWLVASSPLDSIDGDSESVGFDTYSSGLAVNGFRSFIVHVPPAGAVGVRIVSRLHAPATVDPTTGGTAHWAIYRGTFDYQTGTGGPVPRAHQAGDPYYSDIDGVPLASGDLPILSNAQIAANEDDDEGNHFDLDIVVPFHDDRLKFVLSMTATTGDAGGPHVWLYLPPGPLSYTLDWLASFPMSGQIVVQDMGLSNGLQTVHQTWVPYKPDTMKVHIDDLREWNIDETDPDSGQVALDSAATSGERVRLEYQAQ